MAKNLSKKFSLLICCLMTMQALRLVISTAGFCVVRFHIDCSLFGIFISRLVNAVMMSQLFGNWLGDLIVFALSGEAKLWALALANWIEFFCFCTALFSICHTECGHLTGFYWSMVLAYFWWKVGEAPAISIGAPESVDYYFAGFTLSGVWASCLKGLVMRCVAGGSKTVHFHSDALGDVNVKVVGALSVKTTVDYRAAVWLYVLTILLTFLMCVDWTAIAALVQEENTSGETLDVNPTQKDKKGKMNTDEKKMWDETVDDDTQFTTDWHQSKAGKVDKNDQTTLQVIAGIAFGGVLAVPGAMLGVGVGWAFAAWGEEMGCCQETGVTKWCQLIFGIVGALGGLAAGVTPCTAAEEWERTADKVGWVVPQKWCAPYAEKTKAENATRFEQEVTIHKFVKPWKPGGSSVAKDVGEQMAPMAGLVGGLALGALVGRAVGARKGSKKRGTAAGAFFGSFVGLWLGEITNGGMTASPDTEQTVIVVFGFLIVVLGCGTVYSVYPGMAPCSITQFQYFNIIDILILVLSSFAPFVIMGLDLENNDERKLGKTILANKPGKWGWLTTGLLLLVATNICEIVVLSIMQHPFSKMAQKVTTSGWRAVLLTVTMVTSQLTSTGIGFGCVAAGSKFNDGVYNALSTLTLWTMECCGVLGEGYQTELKKYEPGKWPTQGMGKWESHKWWRNKAFSNAWAIWCCIGTTDLRRDIMLCRK